MKNNPAVNLQTTIDFLKKFNVIEGNEPFIRRGKTGGWKDVMSPEILKRFEKWEEDYLKKMEPSTDFLNLIYLKK